MIFYAIALIAVALDHLTKWAVVHYALTGPVWGDVLRLTLTYNTGAAFGMFPGARAPFIVVSCVAAAGLIYANHVLPGDDRARRIPMALILGGNLGNLIDRVRLGQVTDFIDMGLGEMRWPTYNVADIAVVVGAVWLGWRLLFESAREKRAPDALSSGQPVDTR